MPAGDPLADNYCALDLTISLGRVKILEVFVQHEINFDHPDICALSKAVRCNQTTTLAYLLSLGTIFLDDLDHAIFVALQVDVDAALPVFVEAGYEMNPFEFYECIEKDSINCFIMLVKLGLNPQTLANKIVKECVRCSANKILRFVLENYKVRARVLNKLLIAAVIHGFTDVLETLIKHGATGPSKSTWAFIKACVLDRMPEAKLLFPNVDISKIDGASLSELAWHSEYDLIKLILKRGTLNPSIELTSAAASDLIRLIAPEDFFILDDGLPFTAYFLKQRLAFCHKLAKSALECHWNGIKADKNVIIARWLMRIIEIRTGIDAAAWEARRLGKQQPWMIPHRV